MEIRNILIVDTDSPIQCTLAEYLRKNGYTTFTSSNSEETIIILRVEEIHLVILEIALGDEDGLELLRQIKSLNLKVKVIILTSMGYVEDLMSKAEERGANYYLSKAKPLDELSLSILGIKEGKPRKSQ